MPNRLFSIAILPVFFVSKLTGDWSLTWQGTGNKNSDFPGASSIYDGIEAHVNLGNGRVELSESGHFIPPNITTQAHSSAERRR